MGKKISVAAQQLVENNDPVLAWLNTMFGMPFFDACPLHPGPSDTRRYFCTDCKSNLCSDCLGPHLKHTYIQLRIHVHRLVIRVDDMEKFYNCEGIKTYTVGGSKAVIVKKRISRPTRGNHVPKDRPNVCLRCGITMEDPFYFCSIQCKVLAIDQGDRNVDTEKQIEGNGDPALALSLPNALVGDTSDATGKHIGGNGDTDPLALSLPNAAVDNHISPDVDDDAQIFIFGELLASSTNNTPNSSSRKRPRTEN